MGDKEQQQENQTVNEMLRVRMPATISVRDVFFIISVVVSGIIAFGSLSTRTSVIESQISEIKQSQAETVKNNVAFKEEITKKIDAFMAEEDKRLDVIEKDVERNKLRLEYMGGKK